MDKAKLDELADILRSIDDDTVTYEVHSRDGNGTDCRIERCIVSYDFEDVAVGNNYQELIANLEEEDPDLYAAIENRKVKQ